MGVAICVALVGPGLGMWLKMCQLELFLGILQCEASRAVLACLGGKSRKPVCENRPWQGGQKDSPGLRLGKGSPLYLARCSRGPCSGSSGEVSAGPRGYAHLNLQAPPL